MPDKVRKILDIWFTEGSYISSYSYEVLEDWFGKANLGSLFQQNFKKGSKP